MAASKVQNIGGLNGLDSEYGVLTWTSTTATLELATKLSEIYCAFFTRIGNADGVNAGLLTIDETEASNKIVVDNDGDITIDRHKNDPAGTLGSEKFFYVLYGRSGNLPV